jgi:hypothetical protein
MNDYHDSGGGTYTQDAGLGRNPWEKAKPHNPPPPRKVPPIISLAEFIDQAKPPEFLIEPFLQRGYLYTLTAKTSHGKTALFVYLSIVVAWSLHNFAGHHTRHGRVVILAGENPDDTAARFAAMCDFMGVDPDTLPVSIMKGAFDLKGNVEIALTEISKLDDVVLVLIDTSSAYRFDDDEDDNQLSKAWAQAALRRLLDHPNNPTVIAAAHPIKGANNPTDLLPRGGGSFLNEVDGNLTTWATGDNGRGAWTETSLHWTGKIRGISFPPIVFNFFTHPHPTATFHDGSPVMLTLLAPAQDQPKDGHVKPKRQEPKGHERTALKILERQFRNGEAEMVPVYDHGAEGLAIHEKVWRQAFYKEATPGLEQDNKRRTFGRVVQGLLDKECIKCSGDYVWPI